MGAKRTYNVNNVTPTATADTTDLVDSTYVGFFKGGSGTQRTKFNEIYMGGLAAASAPTLMQLARSSTVHTGTPGGGTDAADNPETAALAAPVLVGNTASTLKPQRSSTLKLLNLAFNAFGGIVRWVAREGDEPAIVGNTASLGEATLSAFTGGTPGAMGSHVKYETA